MKSKSARAWFNVIAHEMSPASTTVSSLSICASVFFYMKNVIVPSVEHIHRLSQLPTDVNANCIDCIDCSLSFDMTALLFDC
jgi:hypothetical protein